MSEESSQDYKVLDHVLVPKHEIVEEKEVKKILERFNASAEQFPYIHVSDPAIKEIAAKPGDLIKIARKSQTAGDTAYYRFVVEG